MIHYLVLNLIENNHANCVFFAEQFLYERTLHTNISSRHPFLDNIRSIDVKKGLVIKKGPPFQSQICKRGAFLITQPAAGENF